MVRLVICIALMAFTCEAQQAANVLPIRTVLEDANKDYVPDRIGQLVRVNGTVMSAPNSLKPDASFSSIEDSTGGIVLFSSSPGTFEGQIEIGDRVEVEGTVGQRYGMEIISVGRLAKTGHVRSVSPKAVSADELMSERYAGQLIRVKGTLEVPKQLLSRTPGLAVRDTTGTIWVLLAQIAFTDKEFLDRLLQGGAVEVTGVASQYDQEPPYDSNYCIFPRAPTDFRFVDPPPYKAIILGLTCALVVVVGAYLWSRKRVVERHARSLAVASEQLSNSQALYHSLVAHLPQNVFRKDVEGRFTFANDRFCQLLRRSLDQVLGKCDFDFYSPELAQRYRNDDQKILMTGVPIEAIEEHVDADGKLLWVQVVKSPLYDASGKVCGLQGIFWDITEKRNLQNQLAQAQKLESIGRLAGGIAHDFNNILTIIQAHTSLMAHDENASEAVIAAQRQIFQAIERATNLTRQLLAFSRSQRMKPSNFDLNLLIQRMVAMLERILGEGITITFREAHEPLVISGDPSMIEQVILNLALNARDAMAEGGQLRIVNSKVHASECSEAVGSGVNGDYVAMIELMDTGTGIPPEHLARVCEPFFTTKNVGKGFGLGLATSYGIVKQHDGHLNVSSEYQKGTCVRIFLPLANGNLQTMRPIAERNIESGSETILLIDDDKHTRDAAAAHLQGLGYRVFDVSNAIEASRVWNEQKDSIHIFVTSIHVADDVSGTDLAGIFTAEKPELRVLVCADEGAETAGRSIRFMHPVQYLTKPYSMIALANSIQQISPGRDAERVGEGIPDSR